jgi:hypothetical protein
VKPSEISRDLVIACIAHRTTNAVANSGPHAFQLREFATTECLGSRDQTNLASCGLQVLWGAATKNRCIVANAALKAVVCQFRHRYLEFESTSLRHRVPTSEDSLLVSLNRPCQRLLWPRPSTAGDLSCDFRERPSRSSYKRSLRIDWLQGETISLAVSFRFLSSAGRILMVQKPRG